MAAFCAALKACRELLGVLLARCKLKASPPSPVVWSKVVRARGPRGPLVRASGQWAWPCLPRVRAAQHSVDRIQTTLGGAYGGAVGCNAPVTFPAHGARRGWRGGLHLPGVAANQFLASQTLTLRFALRALCVVVAGACLHCSGHPPRRRRKGGKFAVKTSMVRNTLV